MFAPAAALDRKASAPASQGPDNAAAKSRASPATPINLTHFRLATGCGCQSAGAGAGPDGGLTPALGLALAPIQRALAGGTTPTAVASPSHEVVHQIAADPSGGQALDASTRQDMEQRMGKSFESVRVHTDSRASDFAQALHARAFTRGQHVYFRAGAYRPDTTTGRGLLAHELTHTIQQGATSGPLMAALAVSHPTDHAEREASAVERATGAEAGGSARGVSKVKPHIQRGVWDTLVGGLESAAGAVASAGEWVGGRVAAGAEYIGEKVVAGAEAVAGAAKAAYAAAKGLIAAIWGCVEAIGVSVEKLVTGDIPSLVQFLGIRQLSPGPAGAVDLVLAFLKHPCIAPIVTPFVPDFIMTGLEKLRIFLIFAWAVYNDPNILVEALKDAIAPYIDQAAQQARDTVNEMARQNPKLARHAAGILRHLEARIDVLKKSWWEELVNAGKSVLMPWTVSGPLLDEIGKNLEAAVNDLIDGKFSAAGNDLIDAWRAFNNLLGAWSVLLSVAAILISTVVGAIIGAAAGGVGAVPGAMAGFWAGVEIAEAIGTVVLVSTLAAEATNLAKAGLDLALNPSAEPDSEVAEEDYRRIADSTITVAILVAMMILGALAVRFAKAIFSRIKGLIVPKPPEVAPPVPAAAPVSGGAAPVVEAPPAAPVVETPPAPAPPPGVETPPATGAPPTVEAPSAAAAPPTVEKPPTTAPTPPQVVEPPEAGVGAAEPPTEVGDVPDRVPKRPEELGPTEKEPLAAEKQPAKAGEKRGPKLWPEGPHNQTILRRINQLKAQGYEHIGGGDLAEEVIPTPGGYKSARRPDITMRAPDGSIYRENVGRTLANGEPVPREVKALDDLEKATGVRPEFTPYDR